VPEQIEARDQDDRRDHPLEHAGIQALYDEYSREDSEYTEYAAEKRYLPSVLPSLTNSIPPTGTENVQAPIMTGNAIAGLSPRA